MRNLRKIAGRIASLSLSGLVVSATQALLLIWIARATAPEVFGTLATWLSVAAVLTILLTLRINHLILIADSRTAALRSMCNAAPLVMGGCLFLMLCVLIWSVLAGVLIVPAIVAVGAAGASAMVELFRSLLARIGLFRVAALVPIRRVAFSAMVMALTLLLSSSPAALLCAYFSGQIVLGFWLVFRFRQYASLRTLHVFCRSNARQLILGSSAQGVNAVATNGMPVLLRILIGPEAAGLFFLVQRFVALPFSLVIRAVSEVAQSAFRAQGSHSKRALTERVLGLCSLVAIVCAGVVLWLEGGGYMDLLLGEQWKGVGPETTVLLSTMLIVSAVQLLASPHTPDFARFGRSDVLLMWELGRLLVLCLTLYLVSSRVSGVAEVALAWCVVNTASYGLLESLRRRLLTASLPSINNRHPGAGRL